MATTTRPPKTWAARSAELAALVQPFLQAHRGILFTVEQLVEGIGRPNLRNEVLYYLCDSATDSGAVDVLISGGVWRYAAAGSARGLRRTTRGRA